MALRSAVQSRLLTSRTAFSPSPERNGSLRPAGIRPTPPGLPGVQGAFGFRPGIADEAGGTADEAEGLVPRELETPHDDELHQVAEVQARSRGVESAVIRDRLAREELFQRSPVGRHVHVATPDEFLPDVLEGGVVLLGREDHGV